MSRLGLVLALLMMTALSSCATQTICDYVSCVEGAGGAEAGGGGAGGGGAPP